MRVIPLLREWLNTVAATRMVTARLWLRRSAVWAVSAVFLGLAIVAGLGFIAVGGYLSLRSLYSPWEAGLIVGGTLLLLAFSGVLVCWVIFERQSAVRAPSSAQTSMPPLAEAPPLAVEPAVANLVQLSERLSSSIRGSGFKTLDFVVGALVAGLVFGGSPELRRRIGSPRRRGYSPNVPHHRARYRSAP